MKKLEQNQLNEIALTHRISYETIVTEDAKSISSKLTKVMNSPFEELYNTLADLEKHPRFFKNLKQCIVVDKNQLGSGIEDNEYIVVESIFEGSLGISIKKVKLEPNRITANILSNPFPINNDIGELASDRKKGMITWDLEKVADNQTRLTCESKFDIISGNFFERGIVDHVWLNFYENLMVHTGELTPQNMLTSM
jgi:hypothetical protein